jgi:hypothetical protein
MKLRNLIVFVALLAAGQSFGATGTFGSGLTFVTSSTEGTPIASGDRSSSSAATDLGTFGIGVGNTLNLTGAGILTWKNGGGDVTGAKFNYRVYTVGNTPGSFIEVTLGFGANHTFTEYGTTSGNFGDQLWGDSDTYGSGFTTVDLLAGRPADDYEIEWFTYATTNEGNRFENNGGGNFKATFTVVPEPSSAAICLLASLMLLSRRRN